MKKLFTLLMAALCVFAVVGCTQAQADEVVGAVENAIEQEVSRTELDTAPSRGIEDLADDGEVFETSLEDSTDDSTPDKDGEYTRADDVAQYLMAYGELPGNFITKKEAQELGWHGGGLDDYAYGKSIGGDHFGNHEGSLPTAKGRKYHECDIDTMHADSRGAKRLVYSTDGLIYYTDDHYETFTLLYGEE